MSVKVNDAVLVRQNDGTGRMMRPDAVITSSSATQGNGADTNEDVLFSMQIAPGMMNKNGTEITVQALGDFGANADTKTVRCYVGPTAQTLGAAFVSTGMTKLCDSSGVTANNLGWTVAASIFKIGNYGSNTQKGQGMVVASSVFAFAAKSVALTLAENAVNYVVITGQAGTANANDIVGQICQLSIQNGVDP